MEVVLLCGGEGGCFIGWQFVVVVQVWVCCLFVGCIVDYVGDGFDGIGYFDVVVVLVMDGYVFGYYYVECGQVGLLVKLQIIGIGNSVFVELLYYFVQVQCVCMMCCCQFFWF